MGDLLARVTPAQGGPGGPPGHSGARKFKRPPVNLGHTQGISEYITYTPRERAGRKGGRDTLGAWSALHLLLGPSAFSYGSPCPPLISSMLSALGASPWTTSPTQPSAIFFQQ